MENQNTILPPTYRQLLEEMGKQLNKRKFLLARRIFLVVWPYLLLIVSGYILNSFYDMEGFIREHLISFFVCLVVYLLLAVIYTIIVRFVLTIEKQIWVDSYFDNKNLEPKDSWRIARKLFWPGLVFRLNIFWRYYFLPIALTALALIGSIYLLSQFAYEYQSLLYILISIPLLFVIGLCVYAYYLKIKLRYTWFIFLDSFGSAYTFESMMIDLDKLNDVSKTDTFKKSLVANLGTDTLKGISQITIQGISQGISSLGGVGQLFGSMLRVYGEEAARQVADLGNISAQYILYRFARKALHGEEQSINEAIYTM
ncbi:MAG: hypothetical protein WC666_02275 [Candidatus Paceibacterota bacterium]|jgi:hypothetical protein